jgi:Ca2+:H+ antiporter
VARGLLWGSLVLAPVTVVADLLGVGKTPLFVLAAAALIPLAWLIGEATEHAAEHTGPGIGGFLNASFGNAPELIIALLAIAGGLPNVVRGSIAGSVVSNLLLVLGVSMLVAGKGELDRRSLLSQLGTVLLAAGLFLVPSIASWHGNPERHSLAIATIPVAVVLLLVYVGATIMSLRRHKRLYVESGEQAHAEAWGLPRALVALALATAATALVSEILVHSLDAFARAVGLSEFFIAVVVVAIVGNTAEHGGAVMISRRGKVQLASEIAVSSSAQVALFVAPLAALLSFAFVHPLPLSFRPIEVATVGGAALLVAVAVAGGRARRSLGTLLVATYAAMVLGYLLSGDR